MRRLEITLDARAGDEWVEDIGVLVCRHQPFGGSSDGQLSHFVSSQEITELSLF